MACFWHFYALSAIRIRPPSCYNVKAFPKCLLAAYALEHTMCTMCNIFELSSRLHSTAHVWCTDVHRAAMFGHRPSDFTSVSLNIYHASQTVCKRSAANVLIFMDKRAMLILFYTGFVKRSSAKQNGCFGWFTKIRKNATQGRVLWPMASFISTHISLWALVAVFHPRGAPLSVCTGPNE